MFTFSFVCVQPVLHGNKRRRLSSNAQPGFWPTFRGMTHYYDKLSKMCYRITDHVLNTIASKWSIIIIYLLQCESYTGLPVTVYDSIAATVLLQLCNIPGQVKTNSAWRRIVIRSQYTVFIPTVLQIGLAQASWDHTLARQWEKFAPTPRPRDTAHAQCLQTHSQWYPMGISRLMLHKNVSWIK